VGHPGILQPIEKTKQTIWEVSWVCCFGAKKQIEGRPPKAIPKKKPRRPAGVETKGGGQKNLNADENHLQCPEKERNTQKKPSGLLNAQEPSIKKTKDNKGEKAGAGNGHLSARKEKKMD